jgi:Na+/H+ antiporter
MDIVTVVELATAAVTTTLVASGLSTRFRLPAPLVLVGFGALASLLPGLSDILIEPQVILYGLLPPLLYAAAVRTPFADIRASGDSIALLSIYLVISTVALMGLLTWAFVPGLSIAAALAFGAIVAPTDAIAVSAVAGKARLPRRIREVLEAESLLNDATALVALNAAIAAILAALDPIRIGIDFLIVAVVGLGVGVVVGWVVLIVRRHVSSPALDTGLALTVPFLAFLPAESLGGSGVLAVVTAGLLLGERAPRFQSLEARIAEATIWRTVRFLLENILFFVIGLSISGLARRLAETAIDPWEVIGLSGGVLLALAAVRFANVMATVAVYRFGPKRFRARSWSWGTGVVVSAAGTRGVVTLAAAFLLPKSTPQRELLQFLAFVVVVGTLLEGLALPAIVRLTRLRQDDISGPEEEAQLLSEIRNAGLRYLAAAELAPGLEAARDRLEYELTKDSFDPGSNENESQREASLRLRLGMIEAQRLAIFEERRSGRYRASTARSALASIDLEEAAARRTRPH